MHTHTLYIMEQTTPMHLFLDLETIPRGEKDPVFYPPMPTYADVKVGNRKGDVAEQYRKDNYPKLVEQHNQNCFLLDERAAQKFKDRALHSMEASILCLGYALDDGDPKVITGDEKHILASFEELLSTYGDKRYTITFVGHNIKEFDLKFIFHRAVKYKIRGLMNHFRFMTRENIYDTMEKWMYYSYRDFTSQDNLLKFLGLGEKGDIDGSMVYDLYSVGELDLIYDYCKKDVRDVRNIFKAMQP